MLFGPGRHFALAAATLLGATLLGQEGDRARKATFVRVENADGTPAAGAVVTFCGCLPHLGVVAGPKDELRVQTDARGRAHGKLQPGLCYVAWAVGVADAAGLRGVADTQGWFGCGALLTLELASPVAARRLAVRGVEAWQAQAPLRCVALTFSPGAEHELEIAADGTVEIPQGPFQALEIRGRGGVPMWHGNPTESELVLPPPQTVRVRVIDEKGAPIAGAKIRHRVGRLLPWRQDPYSGVVEDRWRDLGATDAAGRCSVVVPYATDPLRHPGTAGLLLFADAPDRPSVAGGVFQRGAFANDHKIDQHGDELVFECRSTAALVGHVRGVPIGTVAHLACVCKLYVESTSYQHDARAFTAPVDAEGRFRFVDVPADLHTCRLTLAVPDGSDRPSPCFPTQAGRELPAVVAGRGEELLAEGMADLALQVTDATGGPARGMIAYLVPAERVHNVYVRDSVLRVSLDSSGRAILRLLPGKWAAVVLASSGIVSEQFELVPGERTVSMELRPFATMRVELRDGGRPIRGASPIARGVTMRGQDDPLRALVQSLRGKVAESWAALRTDAEGRLSIPFLQVEGMAQKCGLQWGDQHSTEFVLASNDDWLLLQPR